jgi:(p)ppGpp synthase/HD superfamily hydrolase
MKNKTNNILINRARDFARLKHADQKRDYTGAPYWLHTEQVARIVSLVTSDPIIIAAAYLHDILEDTDVTYGQLINQFGTGVAELVRQVTNPSTDIDRAKRWALNSAHLAKASPAAMTIKLADIIDNTSSIEFYDPDFAKVYLAEKKATLGLLKAGDPALWKIVDQATENA